MTFLTPIPAIIAAALVIPALLLMYFLKLRRRPARIASTLLWMKSVEDLQVNAPFQRLRITLLFVLQLLMLIALLLAIARPVAGDADADATRVILLIDRSASMNAVDDPATGRSRLDEAKQAALDIVSRAQRADDEREIMVIAFARTAMVASAFTSNATLLREAIRAIEPTDESADLNAAIRVANAFGAAATEDDTTLPAAILLSDGGVQTFVESAEAVPLRAASMEFVQTGPTPDAPVTNVGIVDLSARRNLEEPATVNILVRAVNAGTEAVASLTVRVDDAVVARTTIDLPPATADAPGEIVRTFDADLPDGAVVSAAVDTPGDALAADDVAAVVVPPAHRPHLAIVAPEAGVDPFVVNLARAADPQQIDVFAPGDWQDAVGRADSSMPDLVMYDRVQPIEASGIAWLAFGTVPQGITTTQPLREGGQRLRVWDRAHPLLRHVELDDLVFAGFGGFTLTPDQRDAYDILASGPDGPVMLARARADQPQVVIGFELVNSNWPLQVGLLVFLQNLLDHAMYAGRARDGIGYRPGEAIVVTPSADAMTISIGDPINATLDAVDRDRVLLPVMRRTGLVRIEGAEPPHDRVAVSLLNAGESDIRVRPEVSINAEQLAGSSRGDGSPRELWPWCVAIFGVLLMIEWLVYASRQRI